MFNRTLIGLVAGTLLSAPAFAQAPPAQTAPAQPQPQSMDTMAPAGGSMAPNMATQGQVAPIQGGNVQYITENRPDLWRASRLEGMNVYNQNNEKVGDIREVLVNSQGQVEAVVIGVGGFLGIGERDVAVPYNSLQWVQDDRTAMTATGTAGTGMGAGGMTGTPGEAAPGRGTIALTPANEPTTTGTIGADERMAATSGDEMRDYPERAILPNATKEQLQNAPQFRYAR